MKVSVTIGEHEVEGNIEPENFTMNTEDFVERILAPMGSMAYEAAFPKRAQKEHDARIARSKELARA